MKTLERLLPETLPARLGNWCIALITLLAFTSASCAQAPGNKTDVEWLIDVLELTEGSVVADIGAGDGDQTRAIARHIGSTGKIYSTELGSESLEDLREGLEGAENANIEILEGDPAKTNLPETCCDAIYLRRVYHHIDKPKAFNKSLYQSLKAGGRLAIIDFAPRGEEADPSGRDVGSQHGVTAKTVVEELTEAGFTAVSSEMQSGRDFYIVMEKPEDS